MKFEKGEKVLLKVSPMKGVIRFIKKNKLSPSYIGLFEVLKKVGSASYRLDLHPSMSEVHHIFYISMLNKYYGDDDYIIHWD